MLGAEGAQRREQFLRPLGRLLDRGLDDRERLAREERRQLGHRGEAEHASDRRHGVGHDRTPRGPCLQHLLRFLEREEHGAGEDLGDRVDPELERRDDAEVTASAAHGPEQLRVVLGVDPAEHAVGGDEFDGDHGVGGQAVRAAEPAHATAEGVPEHADVGRRAGERGEALRRDRGDDVAPERSGLDACDQQVGVDVHGAQLRRAQQQGVGETVVRGERAGVVAGRLRGDREAEVGGGAHGLQDVADAAGHHDRDRALVDGEVPRGAGLVPAGLTREGDATVDAGVELASTERESMRLGGARGHRGCRDDCIEVPVRGIGARRASHVFPRSSRGRTAAGRYPAARTERRRSIITIERLAPTRISGRPQIVSQGSPAAGKGAGRTRERRGIAERPRPVARMR